MSACCTTGLVVYCYFYCYYYLQWLQRVVVVQVSMCQEIHSSVALSSSRFFQELSRYNYVTPTSYLQLLAIFSNLVGTKKQEIATARDRTKTGLDKVRYGDISTHP